MKSTFIILLLLTCSLLANPEIEVIFNGVPTVKYSTTFNESKRESLSKAESLKSAIVIERRDGQFYWKSRENRPLNYYLSGLYSYFIEPSGGGYVKIGPRFKEDGSSDDFEFLEQVGSGISTITYFGVNKSYTPPSPSILLAEAENQSALEIGNFKISLGMPKQTVFETYTGNYSLARMGKSDEWGVIDRQKASSGESRLIGFIYFKNDKVNRITKSQSSPKTADPAAFKLAGDIYWLFRELIGDGEEVSAKIKVNSIDVKEVNSRQVEISSGNTTIGISSHRATIDGMDSQNVDLNKVIKAEP